MRAWLYICLLYTSYPERVVGKIRIVAAEPGCLGRQAVASGFLGGADDDQTDRRLWLSDGIDRTFEPELSKEERDEKMNGWHKAVRYAEGWAK